MRPAVAFLTAVRRGLFGVLAVAVPLAAAGCGDDPPPTRDPVSPSGTPSAGVSAVEAWDALAALAAAAEDRHLSARYTLSADGRADRTVAVTLADDGSWRVDVPEAAPDGGHVVVAGSADGVFRCSLSGAPTCVRVAGPDGSPPAAVDPLVQHPFTDWRAVLTDRRSPLSVSTSRPLPGVGGSCFAVESTSASLRAPVDPGIYCYERDGTLTGVKAGFGTLRLAGVPEPAPPTVTLPGPVVDGGPVEPGTPA